MQLVFSLLLSGCKRDKDGYYWITGRIDDMLNVSGAVVRGNNSCLCNKGYQIDLYTAIVSLWKQNCYPGIFQEPHSLLPVLPPLISRIFSCLCFSGHLMSTAEVEAALTEHPAVTEAAVVSRPHKVKGECLYCFVTLKNSHEFNHTLVDEIKRHGKTLTQWGRGGGCVTTPFQIELLDLNRQQKVEVFKSIHEKMPHCTDAKSFQFIHKDSDLVYH